MTKKIIRIALFFAVPWTLIMVVFNSIFREGFTIGMVTSTIIGGVVTGLAFALVITWLTNRLYKRTIVEITDDEKLIKEGGANHFRGKEGVGGKLVLTDKRLIFKSHNLNIQNHTQHFELPQIQNVQSTNTLGFLTNGLQLQLVNNDVHKFVVDEPGEWVKALEELKVS